MEANNTLYLFSECCCFFDSFQASWCQALNIESVRGYFSRVCWRLELVVLSEHGGILLLRRSALNIFKKIFNNTSVWCANLLNVGVYIVLQRLLWIRKRAVKGRGSRSCVWAWCVGAHVQSIGFVQCSLSLAGIKWCGGSSVSRTNVSVVPKGWC